MEIGREVAISYTISKDVAVWKRRMNHANDSQQCRTYGRASLRYLSLGGSRTCRCASVSTMTVPLVTGQFSRMAPWPAPSTLGKPCLLRCRSWQNFRQYFWHDTWKNPR